MLSLILPLTGGEAGGEMSKLLFGSMAKDTCATESRACALIIVIMDPLTQLAADNESPKAIDPSILEERLRNHAKATVLGGNTLLDALLPLRIDGPLKDTMTQELQESSNLVQVTKPRLQMPFLDLKLIRT